MCLYPKPFRLRASQLALPEQLGRACPKGLRLGELVPPRSAVELGRTDLVPHLCSIVELSLVFWVQVSCPPWLRAGDLALQLAYSCRWKRWPCSSPRQHGIADPGGIEVG